MLRPFESPPAATAGRHRTGRRLPVGAAWLCASVALHGWVLGAVWPVDHLAAAASPQALHVRTVMAASPSAVMSVPAATMPVPPPAATMLEPPAAATMDDSPPPPAEALTVVATDAAGGDVGDAGDRGGDTPAAAVAVASPEARADAAADRHGDAAQGAPAGRRVAGNDPPASAGADVVPDTALSAPTYRTAPPPAMRLSYELRHGMLSGQGVIDWQPAGDRYALRLEGRVASLTLLTQVSTGGFDAHGLAPVRYTDQRMKRAVNAANLQRASGRITFSGPDTEYPLLPGTQDRVSWMVQLASILNANPALGKPGAEVTLFVVGARGEGDIWVFRCVGEESVDTGLGPMPALKFVRNPTKPHDTEVEAWLAPRLHGLPAHARLSNGNDGALDLILREVQ